MAQDYNEYLAANVLNEQQYVTYRLLSRALKVHSNHAKQMLFEFHRKQNSKKPNRVHATYLLTGLRRIQSSQQPNGVHGQDGEDTVMQSSPVMPSSSIPAQDEGTEEAKPMRTVLLVREEDLEQVKKSFDTISSTHIYSLESSALQDLQVLTECNRRVRADFAAEDPLESWRQYGTIQNANVKRRARGAAAAPSPVAKPVEVKAKAAAVKEGTKKEGAEVKPGLKVSSTNAAPEAEKKGLAKPAVTKRQHSDLFKSFAKAKVKPKDESQQSSKDPSPGAATAPQVEDVPMTGFSSDEGEDEAGDAEEEVKAPVGKSKKEREAELKAMMDAEDEEMEDAASPEQAEMPVEKAEMPQEEEPKETMTVENGRRRGRRRVMKKKTVKDEEGYLVTREEQVWESFSEDEPAPKRPKRAPVAATNKPAAKSGGKPGQGNIMSFFGKK